MDSMTTFTSDKERLQEMLDDIVRGKIQLPEFQRGWIWDDLHIRSLLASVSVSYPIGAVMMLESGNPDIRFKPRPVEGVELSNGKTPERYILDGQQRLTSLFQSLFLGRAADTRDVRGKAIKRWYYVKMPNALDPEVDREEAIVGIPEDKKVRNFRNEVIEDYSTLAAEHEHDLFPLARIFDYAEWRAAYNAHWKYREEKIRLFDEFERKVIKRFEQYMVPVIKLLKQTPKDAVCQVFEKVNTGGVSLTVFELVTATFAADEFNLREDWEGERNRQGKKIRPGREDTLRKHAALSSVSATDFLEAVTLLATYSRKQKDPESAVSCKRADVLKLKLGDYKTWADPATQGFIKAARFLFHQKVFSSNDLPYGTQLVPLAAIFAVLGNKADNDAVRQKLARWYWCGVFGELYGSAVETRSARDIVEVLRWIEGGNEPSTIGECNFVPSRLYTLKSRRSAAYKGLHALLMRDGGLDFRTGEQIDVQRYFDDKIDIHHIFPQSYCRRAEVQAQHYDSIINKTPLSATTNRIIGGNAPSVYLKRLVQSSGIPPERLDAILRSHVVDVDAIKGDDYQKFFLLRQEALLKRIEEATGKTIVRQAEGVTEETVAEEGSFETNEEENLQ